MIVLASGLQSVIVGVCSLAAVAEKPPSFCDVFLPRWPCQCVAMALNGS